MESYQHFLATALLMIIIVSVFRLDLLQSVRWILIASFLSVLYDIDHLLYGLYLGKVKLVDVLKNPKIILRVRRETGMVPKKLPTHSIFIALLISLLAGVAVPSYAIPIGIGLISHVICDKIWEMKNKWKERK